MPPMHSRSIKLLKHVDHLSRKRKATRTREAGTKETDVQSHKKGRFQDDSCALKYKQSSLRGFAHQACPMQSHGLCRLVRLAKDALSRNDGIN